MNNPHFPTPKLVLHQIGRSRVPMFNAQSLVQYQARQAVLASHTGAEIDAYRDINAPFQAGEVRHTGQYRYTGKTPHWSWFDETQNIKAAINLVQPFLFARVGPMPSLTSMTPAINPDSVDCVQWLWAMGKVTQVTDPYAVQTHGEDLLEFGLVGKLETPLMRAKWSRWRYGLYQDRPAITAATNFSKLDRATAEDEAAWFVPCSIPDQCDSARFWPRNIWGDYDLRAEVARWEADENVALYGPEQQGTTRMMPLYVRPTANQSLVMLNISGNTYPRVRWIVSKGMYGTPIDRATIRITNQFGYREYSYFGWEVQPPDTKFVPGAPDKTYYMDSTSNIVWYLPKGTPIPLEGAPWPLVRSVENTQGPPVLSWGENLIEVVSGAWGIGITYQYI